jgi:hypothetical protein
VPPRPLPAVDLLDARGHANDTVRIESLHRAEMPTEDLFCDPDSTGGLFLRNVSFCSASPDVKTALWSLNFEMRSSSQSAIYADESSM